MADIVFRMTLDESGFKQRLKRITDEAEIARLKIEDPANLYILTTDAKGKIKAIEYEAEEAKEEIEKPATMEINTAQALATIRDLTIAVQGTISAVKSLTSGMNSLMDSALVQRQAEILTSVAFRSAASEMQEFASAMQRVTNYGDEALLPLMARLSQTFNVSASDVRLLTPALIDFAEANKAAGMTLETAFNLFGRALSGNTAMLSRYGITLDDTRLKTEGVSYLVEKLTEDYGGTAEALADLRLQNANTWGDIKEILGSFIDVIVEPILKGLRWLMEAWQNLSAPMQALTAGIALAIPVITTLTIVISTLTTAFVALKAAINPVAGLLSLIAGGLTVAAFSYAGYAASARDAAEATQGFADSHLTVEEAISEANRAVAVQAEQFNMLAYRLLELKSATSLTAREKLELKNLIQTMNSQYGDYLHNIDLEATSYERLAHALTSVSDNLIKKQIADVYGERYQAQLRKVAELQIKHNELTEITGDSLEGLLKKQEMLYSDTWKDAQEGQFDSLMAAGLQETEAQLEKAKKELNKFSDAYNKAIADAGLLSLEVAGEKGLAGITSEAQRLIEELARLRLSETQRLEAEYQRRLTLITSYTEQESDVQKTALSDLAAWKETEDQKLDEKHIKSIENQFRADIDYYSNLNALGVSSYDALKQSMEEYYDWAKENLPEKEQALILAQLRETNLRHGQYLKEKRERELAEGYELEDIRDAFLKRSEEAEHNTYNARIRELERFYDRQKEKMLEAGLTEVEIEEQKQQMLLQVKTQYHEAAVTGISRILGNLAASQDKESKRGFQNMKTLSMMQATIDTFASANAAYKAMAGIPVVGPALAIAAAAAAIMAGMQNVANISSMEFNPPKAATGGLLSGPSHARGGILIEAEGDEYIIAKDRVRALGKGFFDLLNFSPLAQVKTALSGLSFPSIPMPSGPSFAFASGGSVSSGSGVLDRLDEMNEKLARLIDNPPKVEIHVDPLSNDPVTVSEIADEGRIMRSEV